MAIDERIDRCRFPTREWAPAPRDIDRNPVDWIALSKRPRPTLGAFSHVDHSNDEPWDARPRFNPLVTDFGCDEGLGEMSAIMDHSDIVPATLICSPKSYEINHLTCSIEGTVIGKLLMRDVVTGFYSEVLRRLIDAGVISRSDSVLVVCGGPLDDKVMREIGFHDFCITGIDGDDDHREDVEKLTYENGSFDFVVVHAGLHHCHSPHRALLEMYRVGRKGIVAFESRDSFLMRLAVRLGLTLDYEVNSVSNGKGGVANTGIPNFIYRWTEREVIKTIASFDPIRPPATQFFYDLRLPIQRFSQSGFTALRAAAIAIEPLSRIFALLVPKQCNEFAFVITKHSDPHPWIK